MPSIRPWLGVARAPFLILPVTLVASGAAAAAYDGGASWTASILAAVGLVALHAAVNAFNEASDFRTGIDFHTQRTPFSGGSGTLPSGILPPGAALTVAWGGTIVGVAIGLWFLTRVGWPLVPIGLVGLFVILAYTNVLARAALGEVAAGLGLGLLPVIGAALVQEGRIGPAALAASVPAFCMTFNLLLLNEFPDEAADRAGGRRNLVLVLGRRPAAIAYAAAALATPASIVVAVAIGAFPLVALAGVLPSLLLAAPLRWAFARTGEPVPIPALGANVIWNLATNTVLALALLFAAWQRGAQS
jgi:1,4-dihydroxy-2-naphthoate octaprenyltransferase